jgi:hypothetical protein
MIRRRTREAAGRLITLAVLAVIGLLWIRLLVVQPRAGSEDVRRYPLQSAQTPIAQRKLQQITGEANRLTDAARRGEVRSAVLRLSAGEINAILSEQPEVIGVTEESRVRAAEVRLQPGRIITTATIEAAGAPIRVTAEGQLSARGGLLLYAPETVRVAGLPAPRPIRDAVQTRIQEAFRRVEQQARARVNRVVVGRDQITLHLSSQPQ